VTGIYFKPWKGRRYGETGLFGARVFILGESHYTWDKPTDITPELTRTCIKEQISGGKGETRAFWTNIAIAFLGHFPSLEDKRDFWDSVAFSNYIQESVGMGSRRAPTAAMWMSARLAFRRLVERLKPDVIVATGFRLWENLPDEWGAKGPTLTGARYDETWCYPHSSGTALAFSIRHPSAGFSGSAWHPVIRRGLKLVA
jgi:hypothetical protein